METLQARSTRTHAVHRAYTLFEKEKLFPAMRRIFATRFRFTFNTNLHHFYIITFERRAVDALPRRLQKTYNAPHPLSPSLHKAYHRLHTS